MSADASLPSLSEADALNLLALLNADDPDATAASLKLSAHQAFELISSPAAERYLAARARFDAIRRERRADPIRDEMLTVLRTVAKDETRDPVERRRAAGAALRTLDPWRSTNALLRALMHRSGTAPSSPIGGGGRAPRPEGAPSTRGLSSSSTSQPPTHHAAPALHAAPPASNTPSLRLPVSPSLPPTLPASSVPGLHEAVAAFIRTAGTAAAGTPEGLHQAAAHTAIHRKADFGDHFPHWLESRCALVRGAEARPGVTLFQDDLDGAIQFVTLRRPAGAAQCLIHAVLEHDRAGRARWAVADVAVHDDPSTPPASPDHDSSGHDSSLGPPAHSIHPAPDDSS